MRYITHQNYGFSWLLCIVILEIIVLFLIWNLGNITLMYNDFFRLFNIVI